jgi:hypothetical protein
MTPRDEEEEIRSIASNVHQNADGSYGKSPIQSAREEQARNDPRLKEDLKRWCPMADNKLSNTQLIMIQEMEVRINALKAKGMGYTELRKVIIEEFKPSFWCVPNMKQREEAIGVALVAYAMNDEQREALKKLNEQCLKVML